MIFNLRAGVDARWERLDLHWPSGHDYSPAVSTKRPSRGGCPPRQTLLATLLTLAAGGGGCASTTAPLPPPDEILLVANSGDGTVSLVTVSGEAPSSISIPLGQAIGPGAKPAAGRRFAVLAMAGGDSVAVLDLAARAITRRVAVGQGAGAQGAVLVGETIAYIALSRLDRAMRIDLETGDTASAAVGRFPRDIALTRGRLFVVNANLEPCPPPDDACPAGESWVTVIDPVTNTRSGPRDSIPLPGPGNASHAAVGADGRLYVMSRGGPDEPLGRLSIIDPITRLEVGSFGGFGEHPGPIAADRGERILVSSTTEGLMVFNTRTRSVVRGAGSGIPLLGNSGVTTDSRNNVYGIESGTCNGPVAGRARVFRPDLTEVRVFSLGLCSGAAAVALIPPEAPTP